jgi:shikimate dehydrogenase
MNASTSSVDRYALVGHPVDHSRSPLIHRLFARQTGQNMTYELIDALPEQFEVAVRGFKAAGGKGLNITVPHKERAYHFANTCSEPARQAQAANTLTFNDAGTVADNTDGVGLIRDLTVNLGVPLENKKVLILGAGGASRGIICPLLGAGIRQLTVANRTMARAVQLKKLLGEYASFDVCAFDELGDISSPDIVINATSAGVRGEDLPFPASLFGPQTFCYDLSYSMRDTPFVELARRLGAGSAVQGWGMLVEQAAESFLIWRGVRPDTEEIRSKINR